jgi:ABC-type sugar transport system substrate-binding protein
MAMEGKVGIFVNSVEGYQGCIVREAREAADKEGLALDVFDAGHNAAKQAQDIVHFANQNVGVRLCAMVIPEADAFQAGPIESDPTFHLGARILQKGVGLVILNHGREALVTALRVRFPALPVALVAVDNLEFGRMQGRQLRRLVPRGGTALCVRGNPFDTACRDRSTGLAEELKGSDIVVEEIDARWDADLAEPAVLKWISSPIRREAPLSAVVSQNDHMGRASRQALLRAADELGRPSLKTVPVIGGDGLPDFGLRWLAEGVLTATVAVTLPGRPAVEQLARYWKEAAALPAVTRLGVKSYPELNNLRPVTA